MTFAAAIIMNGKSLGSVSAFASYDAAKKFADSYGNDHTIVNSAEDLVNLSSATIVEVFNSIALAGSGLAPVKKFADRAVAIRRTFDALSLIPVQENTLVEEVPAEPKAPAVEKKAPKAKVPHVAFGDAQKPAEGIVAEFGVSPSSNRSKLLLAFEAKKNLYIPVSEMMEATYGESRKDYKGRMSLVLKGLVHVIKAGSLPYEIRKIRENKEVHFGLFDKAE